DIEIIQLALESVQRAGVAGARLDLNHLGVVRAIIDSDLALTEAADEVIELLSTKDVPGIRNLGQRLPELRPETLQALTMLPSLYGGVEILDEASKALPALPRIQQAMTDLQTLVQAMPEYEFSIDLADAGSGYGYHSGVMFSIYAQGWHDALVRGGRYDGVGRAFGRARPATGFSLDLRKLSSGLPPAHAATAIRAPWGTDAKLVQALRSLRAQGEIVVQMLPGQPHRLDEFIVDRELVQIDGAWTVKGIH